MAFYDKFPYTNFQEINLDRLIHELIQVKEGLNFVIENASLKYADPIQWNITHQYAANTVVIDPETGIAYISTKPVPDNILITNTGYWTPIFDLSALFEDIESDIGNLETGLNTANANISANTAAIETNASNISANTAAIGTNTDAISANTTAIGNNTESIADINADLLLNVPENAKLHGVVGDGVTDDTAALQQVLNDYAWVYLPEGTYIVSNTITLPNNHILCGTRNSTITTNSPLERIMDMGMNSSIEHMRFNGNVANVIIFMRNFTVMRDVQTVGGKRALLIGTVDTVSTGGYISDSYFDDFAISGVEFNRSNDFYFVNCIFNTRTSTDANVCQMTSGVYTEAHTFVNCSFLQGNRALWIENAAARFCRFTNCYFDSASQVFLNAGSEISFDNCWFSNRGGNGVLMANMHNTKFNGCNFVNCSPAGVYLTASNTATLINGCSFASCEQEAIHPTAGAVNLVITNNLFTDERYMYKTPKAISNAFPSGIIANNFVKDQGTLPAATSSLIVSNNLVI